ncbi:MAG: hydroxyacid dehydrogenase [Bacteroidetes bacterium]|nr:MAG: hydroxyacid dehydrogenase [Bacteroidota bacterium]
MAKRKVIFTDPTEPGLWQGLTELGYECIAHPQTPRTELLPLLHDAYGIVCRSRLQIDREVLDAAPRLAFIARSGVGLEHIDLEYAAARGVVVLNSPEGSRDTVAEHTVGLLLMLMNNLARADREIRAGNWIRAANRAYELKGRTVGILGYGNMGQATAQRLSGFACRVVAYDKYRTNYGDAYAEAVDLAQLQAEAEILSIHIPYEAANHYFVNAEFLAAFAHPIWVVNTARGLVLDTAALVAALDSGQVRGAALDVIEYEDQSFASFQPLAAPATFQRLLEMPNVVLSPHIAGWSYESEAGHARVLVEKIRSLTS